MTNPVSSTLHTASSTTNNAASGGLKKQVGPLPVGAWIAVIGGALLISYYLSKKKATTATTDSTATPSALVYTGTGGSDTTTNTTSTTTGFQTNEAWASAAKTYLVAQGIDGKAGSDAIDLYINGQALNAQQNAWIATAIRSVGSPPLSLPPVTGAPTTGDTSPANTGNVWGTTPRNYPSSIMGTSYTMKAGDTLLSIANRAYGLDPKDYSDQQALANEILNANHDKISDVTHITPGTMLYIPVISSEQYPGYGDHVPTIYNPKEPSHSGDWLIKQGDIPHSALAPRQDNYGTGYTWGRPTY